MNFRRPSALAACAQSPSRHPLQLALMAGCIVSGAANLIFEGSRALNESLPTYTVVIWSLVLIVGGAVTLCAAFMKDRIIGLAYERAMLFAVGVGCLCYAALLFAVNGSRASVSGPIFLVIGFGLVWRAYDAHRELRERRQLARGVDGSES